MDRDCLEIGIEVAGSQDQAMKYIEHGQKVLTRLAQLRWVRNLFLLTSAFISCVLFFTLAKRSGVLVDMGASYRGFGFVLILALQAVLITELVISVCKSRYSEQAFILNILMTSLGLVDGFLTVRRQGEDSCLQVYSHYEGKVYWLGAINVKDDLIDQIDNLYIEISFKDSKTAQICGKVR